MEMEFDLVYSVHDKQNAVVVDFRDAPEIPAEEVIKFATANGAVSTDERAQQVLIKYAHESHVQWVSLPNLELRLKSDGADYRKLLEASIT